MVKYIIYRVAGGTHLPVIFPALLRHDQVASGIHPAMLRTFDNVVVVAGGFVDLNRHECYGDSESLKTKSRGRVDWDIIETEMISNREK